MRIQTSRSHSLSIVYSQGSAEKNYNISKRSLKVAKHEIYLNQLLVLYN